VRDRRARNGWDCTGDRPRFYFLTD